MRTKSNQNKLMKIITVPLKVLKKGRDMYVESMMNYAQKPRYTTNNNKGSSVKTVQTVSGLPKSFSTSVTSTRSHIFEEGNDDFRELIRANSTSHHTNGTVNLDVESYVKQLIEEQKLTRQKIYNDYLVKNGNSKMSKGVPRSCSVGLGRIDEGKACEFDEEEEEVEDGVKKVSEVMLRSRSHVVGVGNRSGSVVF